MVIDRLAASRLGVRIQDIDNALNNAFSQRQISTIYSERNQYRVILEVDPLFQRDPSDLTQVYVAGQGNTQVPLSSVARIEKTLAPLVINHQGSFPAVTITYNLAPNVPIEAASRGDREGGGRAASAGHAAHRVRRRRQGVPALGRRAAAGDPGGAAGDLHHPRRAVREPGASADDHLDLAVRRPRRAAGAAIVRRRADRDRLHRHHPADRHRQEERHHDGGLRAGGRARGRACAGRRRSARRAWRASGRS